MWKHEKDIPDRSLEEDVHFFDKFGQIPAYIVDYLIHCYGVT